LTPLACIERSISIHPANNSTLLYLHKVLPLLMLPLAWVSYLCLYALMSKRKMPLVLALMLLWISSLPYTSDQLMRWVEDDALKTPAQDMPNVPFIVVLSGMIHAVPTTSSSQAQNTAQVEWSDPDRFFSGIELYQTQSSSHPVKLIFTGGVIPWWPQSPSEGHYLAEKAQQMGVPRSQILITADVSDTAQEALAVKDLIDKHSTEQTPTLLLVTSAFHMPRAKRVFEQAGLDVIPYPVDFKVNLKETTIMDFIPDAKALEHTQLGLRELMGRVAYSPKPLSQWLN
jgi:uncharacterized SAM-binding protein YcdF (DUF218 family)